MSIFGQLKYQIWAVLWTIVIVAMCCMKMPSGAGGGFFLKALINLSIWASFLC